jgi:uncharacterized membrane protein YccC
MLCVACGQKMRLVQAIPDEGMLVPGHEYHILDCVACGETERRLVFRLVAEPVTEPWTEAPATQPGDGCEQVACADAPDLAVVEPTANALAVQRGRPTEPDQPAGHWQHRIENVRTRLDDLRKRAELAKQEARAAQQDEQQRERFTVFWEDLAARKPPS